MFSHCHAFSLNERETVLWTPQEVKKNGPRSWLVPLESTHLKLSDKPKIKILYVSQLKNLPRLSLVLISVQWRVKIICNFWWPKLNNAGNLE